MARALQTILPTPLSKSDILGFAHRLPVPWHVEPKSERLSAAFSSSNSDDVLSKMNLMAAIAQMNRHHPDFFLSWVSRDDGSMTKLNVTLFSHAFGGLSAVDFEMVRKIDRALESWATVTPPKSGSEINRDFKTTTFHTSDFQSAVSILNQSAVQANEAGKNCRLSLTSYRKWFFRV